MAPSPRSTDRPSLLTAAVVGIGFNPNAGCVWECPPYPPQMVMMMMMNVNVNVNVNDTPLQYII